MGAAGPATGPPHALLELFLGPADSTVPGCLLLGILDPADELVASERGDIPPCRKRQGALDQRPTKIGRKIIATGNVPMPIIELYSAVQALELGEVPVYDDWIGSCRAWLKL